MARERRGDRGGQNMGAAERKGADRDVAAVGDAVAALTGTTEGMTPLTKSASETAAIFRVAWM